MVGYADDTTNCVVIPRPLSHPQVIKSLNLDLAVMYSLSLKWHMRLNARKTKSMVISRSRTNNSGYGDLTRYGEELEKIDAAYSRGNL